MERGLGVGGYRRQVAVRRADIGVRWAVRGESPPREDLEGEARKVGALTCGAPNLA